MGLKVFNTKMMIIGVLLDWEARKCIGKIEMRFQEPTKWVCQNRLIDVEEDAWWFYQALNNYDNLFDDEDK